MHITRKHFIARLILFFTLVFFLTVAILTVSFIHHQMHFRKKSLIDNGKLLSEILAHNSRLGVFSENKKQLEEIVKGLLRQNSVVLVAVYNFDGELLIEKDNLNKAEKQTILLDKPPFNEMASQRDLILRESRHHYEFWSLVKSSPLYLAQEAFFMENGINPVFNEIIGFSRIVLGKAQLKKQIDVLVVKSLFMAIFFWIVGFITISLVVQNVTGPLKKLTLAVDEMGKKGVLQKIPVETPDEIGNLAQAFNNMSASLHQREVEKDQLQTQLRQAQKLEAIGTLAGGIAHDFNNIIGAIIGFSELALLEIKDNPSLNEKMNEILNAGNRASELVDQILTFSRQTEERQSPIQAASIVKEVLKLLRPSIPFSITISENIDTNCGLVYSNPSAIHQIIMNLCNNALYSMKDRKGVLTVSLNDVEVDGDLAKFVGIARPGRYQLLSVEDNGGGIEPDIMERIFEPFFTTKEMGVGIGMGLSVVHGVVKKSGGAIVVDSTPGKGSRFDIYLPLLEEKPILEKTIDKLELPVGTETILFVDNETSLVKLSGYTLEGLGYTVVGASDSHTALSLFKEKCDAFDLVVTDINMSEMSGLELVLKIKALRPDIPIILCTGLGEIPDETETAKLGIRGYLTKPISRQTLSETVRAVIDGSSKTV